MGSAPSPPPAPPPPPAVSPADTAAANKEAMEYYSTTGYPLTLEAYRKGKEASLPTDIDIMRKTADAQVDSAITLSKKYGTEAATEQRRLLELSDPNRFAANEALGKKISEELSLGSGLSTDQARIAEQDIRSAQAARGNMYGNAASAAEVLAKFNVGQQLQQQRIANTQSYLGLAPISGGQIGQPNPNAAGFGANILQPMQNAAFMGGQQYLQGQGINAQNYGTQMSGYNAQLSYMANTYQPPISQAIGAAQGIIGIAGGIGTLVCWVAREVYGESDPRWMLFREWMLKMSPRWMLRAYIRHGEKIAKAIRNRPFVKRMFQKWMDAKISEYRAMTAWSASNA